MQSDMFLWSFYASVMQSDMFVWSFYASAMQCYSPADLNPNLTQTRELNKQQQTKTTKIIVGDERHTHGQQLINNISTQSIFPVGRERERERERERSCTIRIKNILILLAW